MGAADGPAEQSRLAAERVAKLKRQLEGNERLTTSWDEAGAGDEKAVADKLDELVPRGWYVLHDVHWPGRPKANLDHVLVGPAGVVVVNRKNWTGEVRVSSGVLWQGRYARTQAVEGALAQCAAVASVVAPPHRKLVRPLICMATQPNLFGVTNSDVAVAGTEQLLAAIEALPAVLDAEGVAGLYEYLGRELTREQEPGITAFRNVRPGTVVRPAGGLPPGAPREHVNPAVNGTGAGTAANGRDRSGSYARHPSGRHLATEGIARGASRRGRNARARHQGKTGAGGLAMLAAFAAFAVYVLPYWGR
ncbi:nuclease-related domain-containing protein [Pseudarthrobacter sp. NamB4]|uniref:nuclease-related domain-containing protein n=1 Tax=Pseudarthrobacter sp. NamB4 TaxID=2576837 RepID=UPI0010FD5A1E|nr:nuclease-related domain-containing protein [Pseudarthrobacter sp. NamB4]TLM75420.1 NERD domain-containing protein [Pseudarthrobacter sp. NamB4]